MTRSKTDRSTESVSHIRWEKIIKPKQWLERFVAEIDRNRKKCAFEGITSEELLISKFMTAITDTKLRE